VSEAARQADRQQDDWENEGGALDRDPRKKPGNLEKVSEPDTK
jgi:hypothetical protein